MNINYMSLRALRGLPHFRMHLSTSYSSVYAPNNYNFCYTNIIGPIRAVEKALELQYQDKMQDEEQLK